MSWWGKIMGGTLGLVLGGPLGALLGAALGHRYDTRNESTESADARERIQSAFFTATFSVMGRVCKADGRVSEDEIARAGAVMDRMALSSEQRDVAMDLFREGKRADFAFGRVLEQLREECHRYPALLHMFVEIQISAALADGDLKVQEDNTLRYICVRLDIPGHAYEQLVRMAHAAGDGPHHPTPGRRDLSLAGAYAILGVPAAASDAEVKRAYRRRLSQHHPDKLAAQGLPEEMMKIANERTQEIRRAYERIQAVRVGA